MILKQKEIKIGGPGGIGMALSYEFSAKVSFHPHALALKLVFGVN